MQKNSGLLEMLPTEHVLVINVYPNGRPDPLGNGWVLQRSFTAHSIVFGLAKCLTAGNNSSLIEPLDYTDITDEHSIEPA